MKIKYLGAVLTLFLLLSVIGCPAPTQSFEGEAAASRVIDGDTIEVNIYGAACKVRYISAIDLCVVDDRGDVPLELFAVIADAVTTPYQAAVRADLQPDDRAVVVGGTGGVGTYMVQIAKAFGAEPVICIDIDQKKLERSLGYGADLIINSKDKTPKDIRNEFRSLCKEHGFPHN